MRLSPIFLTLLIAVLTMTGCGGGGGGSSNTDTPVDPTPMAPVITGPASIAATTGVVITRQVTTTGTVTGFTASGVSWLTISGSGLLTGTPTASGSYSVTVIAANGSATRSTVIPITVNDPPPSVTDADAVSDSVIYLQKRIGGDGQPGYYVSLWNEDVPSGVGTIYPGGSGFHLVVDSADGNALPSAFVSGSLTTAQRMGVTVRNPGLGNVTFLESSSAVSANDGKTMVYYFYNAYIEINDTQYLASGNPNLEISITKIPAGTTLSLFNGTEYGPTIGGSATGSVSPGVSYPNTNISWMAYSAGG